MASSYVNINPIIEKTVICSFDRSKERAGKEAKENTDFAFNKKCRDRKGLIPACQSRLKSNHRGSV